MAGDQSAENAVIYGVMTESCSRLHEISLAQKIAAPFNLDSRTARGCREIGILVLSTGFAKNIYFASVFNLQHRRLIFTVLCLPN